jgi:hypothetical protein
MCHLGGRYPAVRLYFKRLNCPASSALFGSNFKRGGVYILTLYCLTLRCNVGTGVTNQLLNAARNGRAGEVLQLMQDGADIDFVDPPFREDVRLCRMPMYLFNACFMYQHLVSHPYI